MTDFEGLKNYVFALLHQELPPSLKYHGLHHTIDVLNAIELYIEKERVTEPHSQLMLKTAAVLHDAGFINGHLDHEQNGVALAHKFMPQFGYSTSDIAVVEKLILVTKVPQKPTSHLEEILCDCDLDYLGRDDFNEISQNLFNEWTTLGIVQSAEEYHQKQLRFLESHHYFTTFAKTKRAPKKAQKIQELKNMH